MWKYAKVAGAEVVSGLQRLSLSFVTVYIFFVFNTLYSIALMELQSIPVLVVFVIFQVLVLIVGFCFFRMIIAKNSTTLELFPEAEESECTDDSSESLHLNPFELDSLCMEESTVNICTICRARQPPRTYHCSSCNRCLLLMYKHSKWFDICIGFTNYKFYVVFLFYSILLTGLSIGSFIHGIVFLLDSAGTLSWIFYPILVALVLLCIVLLVLGCEFVQAVVCILQNETLQEKREARELSAREKTYNLGMRDNWKIIMGPKWYFWFLPMWSTSGDGLKFSSSRRGHTRRG